MTHFKETITLKSLGCDKNENSTTWTGFQFSSMGDLKMIFSRPAVFNFQRLTEADIGFCSLRRRPGNTLLFVQIKEEIAVHNLVCFSHVPAVRAICDGLVRVQVSVRLGKCFFGGKRMKRKTTGWGKS